MQQGNLNLSKEDKSFFINFWIFVSFLQKIKSASSIKAYHWLKFQ